MANCMNIHSGAVRSKRNTMSADQNKPRPGQMTSANEPSICRKQKQPRTSRITPTRLEISQCREIEGQSQERCPEVGDQAVGGVKGKQQASHRVHQVAHMIVAGGGERQVQPGRAAALDDFRLALGADQPACFIDRHIARFSVYSVRREPTPRRRPCMPGSDTAKFGQPTLQSGLAGRMRDAC